MEFNRPIVLSIAGLDPCGGAGLLADIKVFEQHEVYGLGISTAQTVQTENAFYSIRWEKDINILDAVSRMLSHYEVAAVKIGIVQNLGSLHQLVSVIHQKSSNIKIIVDPVIRSTTEFSFWQQGVDEILLYQLLQNLELITPNYKEIVQLVNETDAIEAAKKLSQYCNVLLKGGHNEDEPGVDYLFMKTEVTRLYPGTSKIFPKHGSGCILSSAIAAQLARGNDLITACRKAKSYTEKVLLSNSSLLSYHVF
ncbi:hydroxymethylpyrimidine/phosphomethylpyrimidine kinase [Chitinophagaceae bacterium LB-8]|uniref:hydroxymethylpyrimidine kinase n=1 Tax=Paraflavisolibacter caeni TaxID=2982496 RepID=A0A9X2XN09_9BACT|nr:hydroxymethylpyrimidine/phosphomethylpyrimidine kinase [Paraflavisolibacter caeni]MCU7548113.1 hydroxymethylpyrimidine/phosphomethylpyrimidine kinase [Paraflavisolibacter caeni]